MSYYSDQSWSGSYEDTGEYLVINEKAYALFTSSNDSQTYFRHDRELIVYDEQRDGPAIGKKEAKEKYPEYFV